MVSHEAAFRIPIHWVVCLCGLLPEARTFGLRPASLCHYRASRAPRVRIEPIQSGDTLGDGSGCRLQPHDGFVDDAIDEFLTRGQLVDDAYNLPGGQHACLGVAVDESGL